MKETSAQPQDAIVRYIYNRNDYTSSRVRHSAFMPPASHPNELSVCVINDLPEKEIWELSPQSRRDRLKARGDLVVSDILKISGGQDGALQVLIDGIPHARHANIKNIPLDKSLQKLVAIELANKAALKVL